MAGRGLIVVVAPGDCVGKLAIARRLIGTVVAKLGAVKLNERLGLVASVNQLVPPLSEYWSVYVAPLGKGYVHGSGYEACGGRTVAP